MNQRPLVRLRQVLLCCALFFFGGGIPLGAGAQVSDEQSVEQVRATLLNLIRALVDQGVLPAGKAQDILRQAGIDPALLSAPQVSQAAPPPSVEPPKPVIRVPYVPQSVKDEMREEIRQEVVAQARAERWGEPGALPEWLNRVTWYGDVRIRFQRDAFSSQNDTPQSIDTFFQLPSPTTQDTTESRDRLRMRATLGANVSISDEVGIGMRLVTSQSGDATNGNPLSYYVDLGRYGRPYTAVFDEGFLRWEVMPQMPIYAGRFDNPYYSTDLLWAPELTFDGVVWRWEPKYSGQWGGFFVAGAHPLRVSQPSVVFNSASDQWLFALQAGTQWTSASGTYLRFAGTYYDYYRIEGELNPAYPPDNTVNALSAPLYRQMGNTMFNINFLSNPSGAPTYALASKFKLANATATYSLAKFDPVRLSLTLDWVHNFGFNAGEIRGRIGPAIQGLPQDHSGANGVERPRLNGYLASFRIGAPEVVRRGQWQVFGGYRYLERDAVVDAFTSQDYRLGGTDVKAPFLGLNLGISRNVWMTLRYIAAKNIDNATTFDDDTWFLDFTARF